MANMIQIKRSLTAASPGSLANGELAFTSNGNILFIGANGATEAIAGKRFPGTLTANQALVANASSAIDKVIVANLVPTAIYANGSFGTAGQGLVSNGTAVYWGTVVAGSNTQVQFNDSGTANGLSSFTFDKATSTLTATNISGNGASITNVDASTVGGNTASTLRTYTDNQAGNAFSNAVSSATALAGNAYSNAVSAATALAGNAYSNALSYVDGLRLDSVTNTSVTYVATANSVKTAYDAAIAANTRAASAQTEAGSAYTNAVAYAASNSYVNSTFATNTYVNSTFATNTYVNSTFATNSYVTSTFAALSGASFTGAASFVDLTVSGNTILGSNASDAVAINGLVNTSINPIANVTYNLGTNTLRWQEIHAQNVHSEYLYIDKDVQISGNLTVTGNVTTINVATLSVTDSLIQLATNNTVSDLLDIGVYGNYQVSGGDHEHTGFFRDATDGNWKLFVGLTEAPTSTVNIAGTGYAKGTLDAYLLSGGLVSNSSSVALTANSTLAVSMVANTLTLSTPLAATSGGTGFNSYTAADILTAANGTHFSKLSLGTDGYVLQSNGTALVYATLDGGTF
jgi:hypothetical protein